MVRCADNMVKCVLFVWHAPPILTILTFFVSIFPAQSRHIVFCRFCVRQGILSVIVVILIICFCCTNFSHFLFFFTHKYFRSICCKFFPVFCMFLTFCRLFFRSFFRILKIRDFVCAKVPNRVVDPWSFCCIFFPPC